MSVDPTSPTSSPTSSQNSSNASQQAQTAQGTATVNFDQFLQLLVAELQNQDPTSPADPTQYMGQLASFSQVEQQVQTNSKLDTMLTANALSQAEQMIGQSVTSPDGSSTGTVKSVNLDSAGGTSATLSDGNTVDLTTGSGAALTTTLSDGTAFTLPAGLTIN